MAASSDRLISSFAPTLNGQVRALTVSPDVANQVQNRKRAVLNDLEAKYRRSIWIKPDATYGLDQVQIQCFDVRGRPAAHQ